jgi:hypothetical protein
MDFTGYRHNSATCISIFPSRDASFFLPDYRIVDTRRTAAHQTLLTKLPKFISVRSAPPGQPHRATLIRSSRQFDFSENPTASSSIDFEFPGPLATKKGDRCRQRRLRASVIVRTPLTVIRWLAGLAATDDSPSGGNVSSRLAAVRV